MTAYVIADIDIHDQDAYREYSPRRVVVLEFPSPEHARRWYGSQEYAAPLAMRHRASTGKLVLVEGAA
jgi:uncharacterized protein (DUF1330 family)